MKKNINIIFATTYDNIFCLNDRLNLPWSNIKEDMRFFRQMTLNNTIIMGRQTFNSLNNKPLNFRENIIISNTLINKPDDNFIISKSLDNAINISKNDKIFIIGGINIINEALKRDDINNIYINKIKLNNKTISNSIYYSPEIPLYLNLSHIITKKYNNYNIKYIKYSKN
jgi:dihydrofolate reductase